VPIKLNSIQRRVLGVMIEKSLTTPGSYPLTLNTILAGCNQLSCRNPVMKVSEADVSRTVQQLQSAACGLVVRQAPPEPTARANRFEHQAEARLGWDKRAQAIMAELLLRGPQTLGELKGNATRMTSMQDLQMVTALLKELAEHDPPYARELPRQPGRSTTRFDHLLYPDDEPREVQPEEATGQQAVSGLVAGTVPPAPATSSGPDLETRVARLEADLATLREELAALRANLGEPG
jgi:uncharacterized protein